MIDFLHNEGIICVWNTLWNNSVSSKLDSVFFRISYGKLSMPTLKNKHVSLMIAHKLPPTVKVPHLTLSSWACQQQRQN